jgi:hypothetical protein
MIADKHGLSHTKPYYVWQAIKKRCHHPANEDFPLYGARGIELFEPWRNAPAAFIAWIDEHLGPRPDGYSLDRIDNDGHYEPGNLRWATAEQQAHNKRGGLSDEKRALIWRWYRETDFTQVNIAWMLGLHEDTVQRALRQPGRRRIRK